MQAFICDICSAWVDGDVERNWTSILYGFKRNGVFYPENICTNCTNSIIQGMGELKDQIQTKKRMDDVKRTGERVKLHDDVTTADRISSKIEDDNNPATS